MPHYNLYNIVRKRDWNAVRPIIGSALHDFLLSRFTALNTRGGFTLLEVGCGLGNTSLELSHKFSNLRSCAIDIDHHNNISFCHNVVFQQHCIEEFNRENSFDCCLAIAVLPYVRDKVRALLNIWRSLKLNDIAVISIEPHYFGPFALEMFASGDIKWSSNKQALVIHKTSLIPTERLLPCSLYRLLEFNQAYKVINLKRFYQWPSFLKYTHFFALFTNEQLELKPYYQAFVSLYCLHSAYDSSPALLFTNPDLYPACMIKEPKECNRIVDIAYFDLTKKFELSEFTLPRYKSAEMVRLDIRQSNADELFVEKHEWQELLRNAEFKCLVKPLNPIIRRALEIEIDFYKTVTTRYISSEGRLRR